jgi:hypothetical protein
VADAAALCIGAADHRSKSFAELHEPQAILSGAMSDAMPALPALAASRLTVTSVTGCSDLVRSSAYGGPSACRSTTAASG